MKKALFKKLIGMAASASLGCSAVISSSTFFMSSSAAEVRTPSSAAENVVDVIVKLKGGAVLDTPAAENMGTDFIRTPGAAAITADLKASQKAVKDSIRNIYPDIEVKTEYFITVNGFECGLPKSAIPAVEALPEVDYVYECREVSIPKMTNAGSYAAVPQFYQETGCYGEGKVVAIIDSELDITHPMFSDLDPSIKTSFSKEDLEYIIDNIGLNVDISADQAYLNSKVPYCVNYSSDPYLDVPDNRDCAYHGTHVSGIAVGNEFVDEDGNVCAGVAKDAQLLFMGVQYQYGAGLMDDAILSAFEDSLKLGADVISMSFGGSIEQYETDIITDASRAAEKAGIVVLRAAGNEDHYGNTSVNKPDDGSINCFSVDSVLSVASADQDIDYCNYTCSLSLNGEHIECLGVYDPSKNHIFLSDYLEGEIPYVFLENGSDEQFEGADFTDKIVVIQRRSGDSIKDLYSKAVSANAAGVIFASMPGAELFIRGDSDTKAVSISYEDGQKFRNAKNKIVKIEKILDENMDKKISFFSSWGPTVTLDLRPDITGMGGNITSAAYFNNLVRMNGTSMATPFTAGCTAVLLEYLEKNGMDQKTPERAQYIRKLMMNSAELLKDGDMYVSPRQQGAGLVSLNNALNEKVFLTGTDGNAKIKLYDDIDDSFTFTVDAENFSSEDVTFSSAKLVLATNGYGKDEETGEYYLSGQISLNSKSDLSQLITLKAGEKKSVSIDCKLDREQLEQIGEVFQNGFYVYGFIVLEGADNCCDTSIPVLGFRGHWNDAPILNEENSFNPYTVFGYRTIKNCDSFLTCAKYWAELSEQLPEDTELNADNYQQLILENASEGMIEAFTKTPERKYVSNNGNGINDVLAFDLKCERFAQIDVNITNSKGEVVFEKDTDYAWKNESKIVSELLDSDLPDGDYTYNAVLHTRYGDAPEDAQVFSYNFTIDNTAPLLTTEVNVNKKGRRILKVTASDDQALDGVMICGAGKGSIVGSKTENSLNYLTAANSMLAAANESLYISDYDFSTLGRNFAEDLLAGWLNQESIDKISFSDIILPGEDGTVSFEYDITDMEVYSISAIDKAYNTAEDSMDSLKVVENIGSGVWASDIILLQFNEDGSVDVKIGDDRDYTGEYSDGSVNIYKDGELFGTFKEIGIFDKMLVFEDEDGQIALFKHISDESIDDVELYDIYELGYSVCATHLKENGHPYYCFVTDCIGGTEYEVKYYYYYDPDADDNLFTAVYKIDTLSGEVIDDEGKLVDVFDSTITDFSSFQKGLWVCTTNNEISYLFFDSTNMNGYIECVSDRGILNFDYSFNEDGSVKITTENGEITAYAKMYIYAGSTILTLEYEDGSFEAYFFDDKIRPLRFDFFDYSELTRMSILDYTFKHEGSSPTEANFRANEDSTVDIELSKNGKIVETYTIDPITASGYDSEENEVDLPQTGMSGLHKAVSGLAALMLLSGAVLVKKSRKED